MNNETTSDTPETDQMVATALYQLEDDETCPASVYWRMVEFTRTLERERDEWKAKSELHATDWRRQCLKTRDMERERDEWISKAVELSAERESNAMQALAYKAERDEARERADTMFAKHADIINHALAERDELRRWTTVNGVSYLERERDRMQALADANGTLAHSSACEAMDYRRERDEARASLAAAEAWSAVLADVGDDFRAECSELRAAIRNLRDVKGRHHTQLATERLFALLPEASSQPEA